MIRVPSARAATPVIGCLVQDAYAQDVRDAVACLRAASGRWGACAVTETTYRAAGPALSRVVLAAECTQFVIRGPEAVGGVPLLGCIREAVVGRLAADEEPFWWDKVHADGVVLLQVDRWCTTVVLEELRRGLS